MSEDYQAYQAGFKEAIIKAARADAKHKGDHRHKDEDEWTYLGARRFVRCVGLERGFLSRLFNMFIYHSPGEGYYGKTSKSLDELAAILRDMGAIESSDEGKKLLTGLYETGDVTLPYSGLDRVLKICAIEGTNANGIKRKEFIISNSEPYY